MFQVIFFTAVVVLSCENLRFMFSGFNIFL